jgi:hypothetical protein
MRHWTADAARVPNKLLRCLRSQLFHYKLKNINWIVNCQPQVLLSNRLSVGYSHEVGRLEFRF